MTRRLQLGEAAAAILIVAAASCSAPGPGGDEREEAPPPAPEETADVPADIFTDTADPAEVFRRGVALYQKEMFNEAAQAFLQATRMREDDVEAHYLAGQSLLKSFPTDNLGAEREFLKTLELAPDHLDAMISLAQAYHFWGRNEDAARVLERARKLSPDHRGILYSSGLVAARLGRNEEAVGFLEKAVALDPRHLPSLLELGRALSHLSRDEEALGYFEKAIRLRPASKEALLGAGTCLKRLGRDEEARSMLMRFRRVQALLEDREMTFKQIEVRLSQIEESYRAGNTERARELARTVRDEHPDALQRLLDLGSIQARAGDIRGAIETIEAVLEKDPRSLPALYRLGLLYRRAGDEAKARMYESRHDELASRARQGRGR